MKKRECVIPLIFWLFSCTPAKPAPQQSPHAAASAPDTTIDASMMTGDASIDAAASDAGAPEPKIGRDAAIDLLFTSMGDGVTPPPCDSGDPVPCLLNARYAADDRVRGGALLLFEQTGSVAGVDRDQMMNGGYRGMLHLVPVLPTGENSVHLERVALALVSFDAFFGKLQETGGAQVDYRWRSLGLRFFRSVHARTPSAYASGWTIAYNVDGSLNKSETSVRETMFHEIFHLNDAAHSQGRGDDWSEHALGATYDAIVAKCKANTACLSKFAPNDTMVRGGTYYAFQPGNDVREYAAELAVRYYKEERSALGHLVDVPPVTPFKTPFKCTGSENASSWKKIVAEFFGGIDLTQKCP